MGFFKNIFGTSSRKASAPIEPYRPDVSSLIAKLHGFILSADWKDEYAPPELQNADKTTVLAGFKKDAMRELLDPIKEKQRVAKRDLKDFTRKDMAEEIKKIAVNQPSASYGYFVEAIANDFLKYNLPEYIEKAKPQSSEPGKPSPR